MRPDLIVEKAMGEGAAQKREELLGLVEMVAGHSPSSVLEIGTMSGGTLAAWCECAAGDAVIVSVDLPGGEWGGGYSEDHASHLRSFARERQSLTLIRGDSHDPAIRREVSTLVGGVDFLFIDGDHTLGGVRQDFEDYRGLVNPGGLVAFHDVLPHPQVPRCEVSVFWEEIKGGFDTVEFTIAGDERGYGPWGGIGVIKW